MLSPEMLWSSVEVLVDEALSGCDPGDILVICRDNAGSCPGGERCPMCAHITVVPGMGLPHVMAQLRMVGRA